MYLAPSLEHISYYIDIAVQVPMYCVIHFRYLSFHCKLYPDTKWCNSPNIQRVEDIILMLRQKNLIEQHWLYDYMIIIKKQL